MARRVARIHPFTLWRLARAPAIAAIAVLGTGLFVPVSARPVSAGRAAVRAAPAADPCTGSGDSLPAARPGSATRSLTISGRSAPYTSEPDTYCGTLTLPGPAQLQPLDIEIDGKVVATTEAGVDRAWHADVSVAGTGAQVIQAVWHRGRPDQLTSKPMTIHPTSVPDTRPTSLTLIAAALAAHHLARQQALVDDVFALLAPRRLPASLVGVKPIAELDDGEVLAAAADGWSTLTPSQRAILRPYLGPYPFSAKNGGMRQEAGRSPVQECSRVAVNYGDRHVNVVVPPFGKTVPPGWAYIGTTHFKIWYLTKDIPFTSAAQSKATAQYLAAEAEKVWKAETSLFGRIPPSDAGQPCNGGDGRIDIYVIREYTSTAGLTEGFDLGTCLHTPSYMYIAPDYANDPRYAQYTLAHEFFHTLELGSYSVVSSCLANGWLGEATATWVVDYVYPSNNLEQHNAEGYFSSDYRHTLNSPGADFHGGYEDYILLFFLARQFDPSVIRDVWDNLEATDAFHALNAATPGGLAEQWHQFALDNWNRPPVDDYTTWDGIPYHLSDKPFAQINLGRQHSVNYLLRGPKSGPIFIERLSSEYLYITVPDANVAHLTFTHYGFTTSPPAGVRIDALIRYEDGTSAIQDWTSGADHSFCRERPGQDVASVLLMASSGSLADGGNFLQPGAEVQASDACIPDGYKGTLVSKLAISNSSQNTLQVAKSRVSFAYDAASSDPALDRFVYNTSGGTVNLAANGTTGPCQVDGSGSFPIPAWSPSSGPAAQITADDGISPGSGYDGNGVFTGSPPISVTWVCQPGGTFTAPYNAEGIWWQTDPNDQPTAKVRKGQVLSGKLTTTAPDGVTQTWSWNLKPVFGS